MLKKAYAVTIILTFFLFYKIGKSQNSITYKDSDVFEEINHQKNSVPVEEHWGKIIADKTSVKRRELFAGINQIQSFNQHKEIQIQDQSLTNIPLPNLQGNPQNVFDSLKEIANKLTDSPVKQAKVYALMAKLPSLKREVKEEILLSLVKHTPSIEMQRSEIKSYQDQLRFYSTSPEELAFYIKYKNYADLSNDKSELFDKTVALFKEQKNLNVKLFLSSMYLSNKDRFTDRFIDEIGLKTANLLVPANIEIKRSIDEGYIFVDHILPQYKE